MDSVWGPPKSISFCEDSWAASSSKHIINSLKRRVCYNQASWTRRIPSIISTEWTGIALAMKLGLWCKCPYVAAEPLLFSVKDVAASFVWLAIVCFIHLVTTLCSILRRRKISCHSGWVLHCLRNKNCIYLSECDCFVPFHFPQVWYPLLAMDGQRQWSQSLVTSILW